MYLEKESKHYTFHYTPGSVAERDIREICTCQETCFVKITGALHVSFPMKIHYWLCDSPEDVGRFYGDDEPCNGFARYPDTVYAVYNEDIKCIGAHEDAHLIARIIALPESRFLKEGLAMYFDETWWGEANERWVKRYQEENQLPEIKELFADSCFSRIDCSITYPIAGAFTKFLIARYGQPKYIEIYKSSGCEWEEAFNRCLGKGIEEVAQEFLSQICQV